MGQIEYFLSLSLRTSAEKDRPWSIIDVDIVWIGVDKLECVLYVCVYVCTDFSVTRGFVAYVSEVYTC